MDEESKPLTTFSTPQGHFEWNVLPFGLKNAPQIFQRKMDDIFKEYDFIHVYVDDMLISSENEIQNLEHLNIFIDLCTIHGIGLSKKKSIVGESKIEFLGPRIKMSEISADISPIFRVSGATETIFDI